jgi:hypothetical protein
MSHDKIRAADRKRMAENGRAVRHRPARGHQELPGRRSRTRHRPVLRREMVRFRLQRYGPGLPVDGHTAGGGRGHGGVELNSTVLRVLVPGFHLDIPRASVRSATRSARRIRGTIGVHSSRGRWLVNGSYSGLVELTIEPPCYTPATQHAISQDEGQFADHQPHRPRRLHRRSRR